MYTLCTTEQLSSSERRFERFGFPLTILPYIKDSKKYCQSVILNLTTVEIGNMYSSNTPETSSQA